MLRTLLLSAVLITITGFQALGQMFNPVKWEFSTEHISNDEYWLSFVAQIDEGWTVYSYYLDEDAGPVPTYIEYDDKSGIELIGDVIEEGAKKEGPDKVFDNAIVIKFLSDQPYKLKQKIKVLDASKSVVGYLGFMTCDDQRCLPPTDKEFEFNFGEVQLSDNSSQAAANPPDAIKVDQSALAANRASVDDQLENPVAWDFDLEKLENGNHQINFKADIKDGWKIYSYHTSDNGPFPTLLTFEEPAELKLIGEPKETGDKTEGMDKLFEVNVITFSYKAPYTFSQEFKVLNGVDIAKGYLSFMACNDRICTPPTDIDFYLDLKTSTASKASILTDDILASAIDGNVIDQQRPKLVETYATPLSDCGGDTSEENNSMIWMFIFGFLGGLVALMTPCVFPMIPLTVSFFTKDTKRKGWVNGAIYGASIIVIYVTLGLGLTAIFGEEALNRLSTNWIANTIFFLIFIFFAFSFFGYYELTLPESWTNSSDRMADKGGLIGIFFMAFTLALVSFSCTGPIIGSAIVQAAANKVGPFIVMLGFAIALALPFGFFAAFPSWLNSLPKSGGWLNTVKVVLGFVELAFAFKFLSVADMTNGWDVLKYEPFMIIWILCALGLALYMFGMIKFPHDSPLKKISKGRWAFGLGSLALAIYFATGFTYNPTTESYSPKKLMSGIAPPAHYNFFLAKPKVDPVIKAKYPSYTKCANGINCFKDYYEGLAYAKETNKPLFLDHTGHGCVNCRLVEEHIWINDDIRAKLIDDFVLVSLYVDEDKKLEETLISATRKNKIRNVGNKWADFQIVNFQQNSQPLYVMVTPDEEVIAAPRGHVPSEGQEEYLEYLKCGLDKFESLE